jgi:outer membrane protein TolC
LGETILQGKYSIIDRPAKLRYEAAEENEHMSRETQKALRDDLIYFMLLNYLNAQRLSKKRAVIEGIINRDKDLVRVARARIQSGTGVRLDYLRAESLLKKDELRAKELDSNYKKAIRDLSVLLGHEVDLAEVEDLENSSTSVSKVTGERADLNSAKKMVLVTEKLKSQAASESSVRLNVFSGVGLVGSTVLGGRNAAVTGTVGIQLSIPLLDGGYQEGKLQEAAAKNRSAVLQVAQLERESKTQQEQAAAQLLDSQSSLEVAKKYLELTKEEINLAEKRFKVGSGSGLEMSNAHANYSTAEEQHTEALFGFELAKLNHFKANGAVEKYVINEGAARP